MQDPYLVLGYGADLRAEVAFGDLLTGLDQPVHRAHDPVCQKIPEPNRQHHAGNDDSYQERDGVIPDIHILLLQNPHIEHAHPVAEDILDGLIRGDIPIAHHKCPIRPPLALAEDVLLYLL